jgi:hypothetical protein
MQALAGDRKEGRRSKTLGRWRAVEIEARGVFKKDVRIEGPFKDHVDLLLVIDQERRVGVSGAGLLPAFLAAGASLPLLKGLAALGLFGNLTNINPSMLLGGFPLSWPVTIVASLIGSALLAAHLGGLPFWRRRNQNLTEVAA